MNVYNLIYDYIINDYYIVEWMKYDKDHPYLKDIKLDIIKFNGIEPLVKFIFPTINEMKNTGLELDMKIFAIPFESEPNKIFRTFLSCEFDIPAKINIFLQNLCYTYTSIDGIECPIFYDKYKNGINIFMVNQEISLIYKENNKIMNEYKYLKYIDYVIVKHKGSLDLLLEYKNSERCSVCCLLKKYHSIFEICKDHKFELDKSILKYEIIYTKFRTPNKILKIHNKKYDINNLKFVHINGKSAFKQTDIVIKTFIEYPELGNIDIICNEGYYGYQYIQKTNILNDDEKKQLFDNKYKNINFIKYRLNEEEYNKYHEDSYVHICPSLVEGYGHYINEARNSKSIIITLDKLPMNELINKNNGILIRAKDRYYQGYWGEKMGIISTLDLKNSIIELKNKTNEEIYKLQENVYNDSIKDNNFFNKNYNNFINNIIFYNIYGIKKI